MGWRIAAYLWTKSIASGLLLVAAFLIGFGFDTREPVLSTIPSAGALVFVALTAFLLVIDLKRPMRFFYLITKPNQDAEAARVEEIDAGQVGDDMPGAAIDQLDQLLAQFGRGVDVDLARHPQNGAVTHGDRLYLKWRHVSLQSCHHTMTKHYRAPAAARHGLLHKPPSAEDRPLRRGVTRRKHPA